MAYTRPGVYVTEGPFSTITPSGSGTVAAAFIGQSLRGPVTPTLVTSWTAYKNLFGDLSASYNLGYAVYHYFVNGGRDAYISRNYNSETTTVSAMATRALAGTIDGTANASIFTLRAENPGTWGNSLTVTVTAGNAVAPTPSFNLSIKLSGTEVEAWNELSLNPADDRYINTVLNTYSTYIRTSGNTASYTSAYTVTAVANSAFSGGLEGVAATSTESNNEIINAVERLDSVNQELLINMVGISTTSVVNSALSYCENRGDCFLVIDPAATTIGSDATTATASYSASSYGAVYYPKLQMIDPAKSGSAAVRETFPGGAILGLYSRVEAERTVAKAPAGYGYDIRGAFGLTTSYTEAEQGTLYTAHINTLKAIPGAGVIINGARTLKKTNITKYIPTRRSLNYIKAQCKLRTAFAVFEPNNDTLYAQIENTLSKFLSSFWSSGGLKGRTTAEAFFVTCNSTNNTVNSVEQGEVRVQVGVALQTPAEFIIIDVTQFTGGTSSQETI